MISFPACRLPRTPPLPRPPASLPSLLSATQCKHSVPEECWTPWPPLQFTRFSLAALCSSSPLLPLPISPSPPPLKPLHSTPLSLFFFPALHRSFSSSRLSSSSSSSFFSYPIFFPVLVPHRHHQHPHLSLFFFFPLVLSFLPFLLTSSLPPFIFCLSPLPLPLASFTSQSFHSIAVNRVSFQSSSPSLYLVHFTDVIGTSGSKLTGFGLETCSSSETNRYKHDNM